MFQRESPGIALIGNEGLQHRQCHRFISECEILLPANQARRVWIMSLFRQKPADFHLWIRPWFKPSEEFKNETIAVHDGAVALLPRQYFRFKVSRQKRAKAFNFRSDCALKLPS